MHNYAAICSSAAKILTDTETAIKAVCKNSKLRNHFIRLVLMNNIFKAFIVLFSLDDSYSEQQHALLKVLIRVEQRRDRQWLTVDKIILNQAFSMFITLLSSATEEQLSEVIGFIENNNMSSQWLVTRHKT